MASLEELRNERIKKIDLLVEKGIEPYPASTAMEMTIADMLGSFPKLSKRKKPIVLAGRVLSLRGHGGVVFIDLYDGTGTIQSMFKKDELSEDRFKLFVDTIDIGDFLELKGSLFVTKRKENTLLVADWKMLVKSLRPLPDKWSGLKDTEERFRKRYLDIIMDEKARERFVLRSRLVSYIRNVLNGNNFIEVETPILQALAGGATAKPFSTHHNALGIDLNLRIAPELYLKKLLIGGFPKVYELGKSFRNEGIDATHNPEFTTVEIYEAFSDANKHMDFIEVMLRDIVKKINGGQKVQFGDEIIDFSKKFSRVPFLELFKKDALVNDPMGMDIKDLILRAKQLGVDVQKNEPRYKILDNIYKKISRPKIIQPTYLVDYPYEFSPLAKRKKDNDAMIDRYQLVVGGIELANAFSELNDPLEQRSRFVEQEQNRSKGDEESQPKDEEFIEALEYGMPPAAGIGISIDRLAMLLTDTHNIREIMLFPTLRPKD